MIATNRTRRAVLALALMSALSLGACTKRVAQDPTKPSSPALDQISVQLARVVEGVGAGAKVKRALLADGKITKEQSHALTLKLQKVAKVASEANDKASEYDSLDPAARQALAVKFGLIRSAYNELRTDGVVGGNSGIDKALDIIGLALSELTKLVGEF